MKILVTGGAGFIGSNIVESLVRRGDQVVVLDNFSTGKHEYIKPFISKIKLIKGDIRNESHLNKALNKVQYVLHQAALRSVPRSIDDPLSSNDVNVGGTLKLLVACRRKKVKRIVYASSSSVYGASEKFPQKETDIPRPLSPYAVSKLAGEHYAQVFSKTFGLETVCLRYFNVIGPRQNPESKYAAVLPKFIQAVMMGKAVEVHGNGLQSRDFSYVENVISANILAMTARNVSGEVFNIACSESHSIIKIVEILESFAEENIKRHHTPARAGDVRKTYASIVKAKKMLGYKPVVHFKEGVRKTWEYFVSKQSAKCKF
ncbi:MAG: SDR family oxidoreductase [bacterium]